MKIAIFLLLRTWLHLVCAFGGFIVRNTPPWASRYLIPLLLSITLLDFTRRALHALGWRPVVPRIE